MNNAAKKAITTLLREHKIAINDKREEEFLTVIDEFYLKTTPAQLADIMLNIYSIIELDEIGEEKNDKGIR